MHEELRDELQSDIVEILGVNEIGYDNFEYVETASSQLPWIQDVEEVNAWDLWEIRYRDVVILDQDNIYLTTYNLTDNPMWTTTLGSEAVPNESYLTLKNIFRHVALYNELPPEPEPEDAGFLEDTDSGTSNADAGEDILDSGAWYIPPGNVDGTTGAPDAGASGDFLLADSGAASWADSGFQSDFQAEDAGSDVIATPVDSGQPGDSEITGDAGGFQLNADAGAPLPTFDAGFHLPVVPDSGTADSIVADSGSFAEVLDAAIAQNTDAGSVAVTNPMSDFLLADGNPYSPTLGSYFSPRDNLGKVSAYYFGSGG